MQNLIDEVGDAGYSVAKRCEFEYEVSKNGVSLSILRFYANAVDMIVGRRCMSLSNEYSLVDFVLRALNYVYNDKLQSSGRLKAMNKPTK